MRHSQELEMKTVSFAIPVYRNQGSLRLTYEKIDALFKSKLSALEYEIVFVDDGSDDNSLKELLEIHENDRRVKIVSFSRNFGQLAALNAGLNLVTGDCSVVMSADLQDPVELVEGMVSEWEKGSEIVIGHRIDREDDVFSKFASRVFYSIMRVFLPKLPSGGFDFCLLDRKCVDEMNKIREKNKFFQGDIVSLGFNVKFIPYKRLKRTIGRSQWTLAKKVKFFLDSIISTSYVPLRFMSFLGFLTSLMGVLYGAAIVYSRMVNQTPFTGWAPIMILLLVIGGVIMLMLGIIGEYIWRIYDEVKKRPTYIIKDKIL
jgi:polyisoprenyl-phosphate glycosyltransferase